MKHQRPFCNNNDKKTTRYARGADAGRTILRQEEIRSPTSSPHRIFAGLLRPTHCPSKGPLRSIGLPASPFGHLTMRAGRGPSPRKDPGPEPTRSARLSPFLAPLSRVRGESPSGRLSSPCFNAHSLPGFQEPALGSAPDKRPLRERAPDRRGAVFWHRFDFVPRFRESGIRPPGRDRLFRVEARSIYRITLSNQ